MNRAGVQDYHQINRAGVKDYHRVSKFSELAGPGDQ